MYTKNVEPIADEILAAIDGPSQIAPITERDPNFRIENAHATLAELRRKRIARGERHVGRKIGFTNGVLWAEYKVFAPIWGDMFDTTIHPLADLGGTFDPSPFCQPRIEPEIAFKLAKAPEAGMDEPALLGCMEWFVHGFEIVQCPFPDWHFAAADAVAAAGLHGAFLVGRPHRIE